MGTYREVEGDLIKLAKQGDFDVIGHGVNCFCRMKRGLAPQMAEAFGCDKYYPLEHFTSEGNINKLGQLNYKTFELIGKNIIDAEFPLQESKKYLSVVNAYTQYQWSTDTKPLDYEALTLCLRKMNHIFKGKHIGLPMIGCHLAGGDWNIVREIIKKELKDCNVTIVIFPK